MSTDMPKPCKTCGHSNQGSRSYLFYLHPSRLSAQLSAGNRSIYASGDAGDMGRERREGKKAGTFMAGGCGCEAVCDAT